LDDFYTVEEVQMEVNVSKVRIFLKGKNDKYTPSQPPPLSDSLSLLVPSPIPTTPPKFKEKNYQIVESEKS
jgi:hypothetical protein